MSPIVRIHTTSCWFPPHFNLFSGRGPTSTLHSQSVPVTIRYPLAPIASHQLVYHRSESLTSPFPFYCHTHQQHFTYFSSGVYPMDYQFPWPVFDHTEENALSRVLKRRKWFNGEETKAFEAAYAAFQGARFGAACTSGTTALEIALEALEIGPGDEVIVPPYTFVATATAVLRVGATPVFADVDATWCLDPAAVEAAITPRTRAIMPVHFGGAMANIELLAALAERRGLALLEDACHA
ncbi:MAG: aminotransferase class I/II-fold pyridoxal phosphate-dependent enzyme, partial [Gammaproteobacteria bacterium]|nr:aminotransferase class I/II-fold pyridoxal phosphate-dependent enzyme [Gammaproteobacteria bacterium]